MNERIRRLRQKGRVSDGAFTMFPRAVLNSDAVRNLPPYGKALLLDLGGEYRYGHNGDICASRTLMKSRGWRSHHTLAKALRSLLHAGLIELTRQGGLHMGCSLYGFTWEPIDHCEGKLDVASTKVASGLWKHAGVTAIRQPITKASPAHAEGLLKQLSRPRSAREAH